MGFKPGPVGYRHIRYNFDNLLNICFYRKMKKKITQNLRPKYYRPRWRRSSSMLQLYITHVIYYMSS